MPTPRKAPTKTTRTPRSAQTKGAVEGKGPAPKVPPARKPTAAAAKKAPAKRPARKAPGHPPEYLAAVADRRAKVLDLRLAGVDNLTIGHRFHKSSSEAHLPPGHRPLWAAAAYDGEGEALANKVSVDVKRALKERLQDVAERAEELIARQDARLEQLLAGVWVNARKGGHEAVQDALRILERQARLHGLDGAIKVQHDIPALEAEARATLAELLGRPLLSSPTGGS